MRREQIPGNNGYEPDSPQERKLRVPSSIAGYLGGLADLEAAWAPGKRFREEYALLRCKIDREAGFAQAHGVAFKRRGWEIEHEWLEIIDNTKSQQPADTPISVVRGSASYLFGDFDGTQTQGWHIVDNPAGDIHEAYNRMTALYHGARVQIFSPTRSSTAQRCLWIMNEFMGEDGLFRHPVLVAGAEAAMKPRTDSSVSAA